MWDPRASGCIPRTGHRAWNLTANMTHLGQNRAARSLKLLYHVSGWLGTLAATPGDSHHRNSSSRSKVRVLEETCRQWPNGLLGKPCFEMGWRSENTNSAPNFPFLITSKLLLPLMLSLESLPGGFASRKFSLPTQKRETEAHRHISMQRKEISLL